MVLALAWTIIGLGFDLNFFLCNLGLKSLASLNILYLIMCYCLCCFFAVSFLWDCSPQSLPSVMWYSVVGSPSLWPLLSQWKLHQREWCSSSENIARTCHHSSLASSLRAGILTIGLLLLVPALSCVHIDASTSTCPGFALRLIEALLVRAKRSRWLVEAQRMSVILNEIESRKCFANKQHYFITSLIILPTVHLWRWIILQWRQVKFVPQFLYIILLLFMVSLLCTG